MKLRKCIAILLPFAMAFSLSACGGGDGKDNTGGSPSSGESIRPSGGLSNTGNSTADEDYSWWEGDWVIDPEDSGVDNMLMIDREFLH